MFELSGYAALCAARCRFGDIQHHMSRTHRDSLGKSSKDTKPSKWSIGKCSTAAGSVIPRFTAIERWPSSLALSFP
jgi:hypothetical protein